MPTREGLEREWLIVDYEGSSAAMCPVCNELYPVSAIFAFDICPGCHARMVTLKGSRDEKHRSLSTPD